MPKNLFYEDVKVLKKPFKRRLKTIFAFFLFALMFGGVLFCSVYLSKALSVGNISQAIVFGGSDISIKDHSYYMVALGRYDDLNEAQEVALGSTLRGASGFVWKDNNSYLVVGNIYSSLQDAENVKKNIGNELYKTEIFEIKFPKIKFNFEDLENSDVKKIRIGLENIDKIYQTLYDYSIKFDSKDMNNFAVCNGISMLRGELKSNIINIQSIQKNSFSSQLQEIINSLTKIDELLDSALLIIIDNSATNYTLKNSIACVVENKYNLYNLL